MEIKGEEGLSMVVDGCVLSPHSPLLKSLALWNYCKLKKRRYQTFKILSMLPRSF